MYAFFWETVTTNSSNIYADIWEGVCLDLVSPKVLTGAAWMTLDHVQTPYRWRDSWRQRILDSEPQPEWH